MSFDIIAKHIPQKFFEYNDSISSALKSFITTMEDIYNFRVILSNKHMSANYTTWVCEENEKVVNMAINERKRNLNNMIIVHNSLLNTGVNN